MNEWKEFFKGRPLHGNWDETWEEAYKAFFARNKAEVIEELTERFG
ncbi:hypothetical protein LCGC14_2188370, partial [marine sediment metagenome]